ncbi:unnamed protein product [Soboliphyme baturini]|uniref:dynamin GTPase n=1 Tax=Soboliphyme baturini TaxID=241478 RepID=A0A183IL20_9BILA|nr:unnamed protein product [Soboliphyme baturini]
MESVVRTVNDIQTALFSARTSIALELPQIAVVGSQSSGKSSVLESLVGKDFLPRGSGIVTRRPLILQLIRSPEVAEEFGQFAHTGNKRLYDFSKIRDEIQRDTERVCGPNKAIADVPINLRIYSPHVVDLTLIDLPGLTKVPVGDQPKDIESQILELVLRYISQKNCLILAVCQANSDLANAEALKLAQMVDRQGERTIGVLTKLDLMDEGTNARRILENKVIPLKYGYVGVVNRSQKDIEQQKDLNSALASEQAFFDSKPHIMATLPSLRLKLEEHLCRMNVELDEFSELYDRLDMDDDPDWELKTQMLLLIRFTDDFRAELLGNSSNFVDLRTASCGSNILNVFRSKFPQLLSVVEWTDESEMKRSIAFAIRNSVGVRVGIFTPDQAFEETVRTQVVKLKDPVFVILDMALAETVHALRKCSEEATLLRQVAVSGGVLNPAYFKVLVSTYVYLSSSTFDHCSSLCVLDKIVFNEFPRLREVVESEVSGHLTRQADQTRQELNQLFDYELAYINSNHDDFVGFHAAEINVLFRRRQVGSEVVKEGYLTLSTGVLTLDRRYWFELTPNNIVWYLNETKADRRYVLPIDEYLKLKDSRRANRVIIFHSQGKNIFKDSSHIELCASSIDEATSWKQKMIDVGIFEVNGEKIRIDRPYDTGDPHLERQVEVIWLLLDSYMKIVTNNMLNMVPKIIPTRFTSWNDSSWLMNGTISALSINDIISETERALRRQ